MAFRDYTTDVVESGDHLPSYTTESAVKQGQLVKHGSSGYSVVPSNADGEAAIGFAAYDAAAGDTVAVARDGCEVLATSGTGTIAEGDLIASYGGTGNAGEVDTASPGTVDFTNSTTSRGDYVVGEALQDDAGANDDVRVEVDLQNYFPPE